MPLIALVLAILGTPPADTLRGHVRDPDGRPLVGADILLPALDRGTRSGPNGQFALTGLPEGRWTLVVRMAGYAPDTRDIVVPGEVALAVTLVRAPFALEAVTVSASRAPLAVASSPLPVSGPSPEALRREHDVSLAHTIDGLPGVHALTTGGQIGKPAIRGLAGSRVLVLQNGLRLEDYSWSDEDGPSIDPTFADHIEVIRGPASLLYGSDAIGGVVDVRSAPLPEGSGVRGAAEVYTATAAREVGTAVRFEGAAGALGWRLAGSGRAAEALHTPDGELENTGFGSANGEAAVALRGAWGSVGLRYTRYGGEFKLLEANGPPPGVEEGEEEGPERKLSDDRVQVNLNLPLGPVRLEPRIQWQRHWLSELADAAEVGGSGTAEITVFDLVLSTVSGDLLAHLDVGSGALVTAGVSGGLQHNDSRAQAPGLAYVPDADTRWSAVFAVAQARRGPVTLLGGARVDARHLEADATPALSLAADSRSHTAWSGNLGAAVELVPGVALTANVGRSWRAPTLFELYANGPLLAEARYELGDATLTPEHGLNLDAGLRWRMGNVRGDLTVYRNRITDFIHLVPTGERRPAPGDPADSLQVFRHEAATAVLVGGEVGLEADVTPMLTLRSRADLVRGTDEALDAPLPLMPPAAVDIEAELHGDRVFLTAGADVAARQTRLSAFDYATDGYVLFNLGAGAQVGLLDRVFRVDLRVHNLANTAYRSFLSRYKQFALNPGRDVVIRVSTGF